jgi:uncharacterized protein YwbE
MNGQTRASIKPGMTVLIILKKGQCRRRLTKEGYIQWTFKIFI